jgi:hypothetical protein
LPDKYELWLLRYCWNMESPKRQQTFFFFSFFFCVGPCPVTFKVLSWRLSFSCYRQSVVVVENFFLSCGLPSKCVVVVENEFLSLLWVTYLPMICFQRFQLSSIWYTDVGGMNNLTTNALWIAHLLLELDFADVIDCWVF